MQQVDVLLHGIGTVNRKLLQLFQRQQDLLAERHNLTVRVVGAIDSGGGVFRQEGIDPETLLEVKQTRGTVAAAPAGEEGLSAVECLSRTTEFLTLMEGTLVDLETGGPGLVAMREALKNGHSVVSANKGPLVLAFSELEALASTHGGGLMYSATVAGGLPAVNVGRYDLAHAIVLRLEGIVNGTTHHLLTEMARGRDFDEALREAQERGIAEADPTLDISGWDAANKLIILANSVLRYPATKQDVTVEGIEDVTPDALQAAERENQAIKLIARAERAADGRYQLSVRPRVLPLTHPLARLIGHQMGLWLETDINGDIFLTITEEDPTPTAAAMLRDLVLLARGPRAW
ncbi:MAG: homoserine dehydrogenase [Chloroflexota bacterium]|nr:homoserine dehydrogenase [Chloroflexota bacterium]